MRPSRKPPSKQYRRKRCGAKTRSGKPCRAWAMPNGRCRMHGGSSPKGREHPSFKTGLHSKYFRQTLKDILGGDETRADEIRNLKPHGVEEEILTATAILSEFAKRRPRDVTADWFVKAMGLVDYLARQKERQVKMQKELRTITLEELENIIRRYTVLVHTAVEKIVTDKNTKDALLARLHNIPEEVSLSLGK